MQAFCDCDGVFKCSDCELPGNTNDIIAYKQIELFKFLDFVVPDIYQIMLDETYCSIGAIFQTSAGKSKTKTTLQNMWPCFASTLYYFRKELQLNVLSACLSIVS